MTLEELKKLKVQIAEHKEELIKKDFAVDIISEAIGVLEDLNANRGLVGVWYACNKEEVESIIDELKGLS